MVHKSDRQMIDYHIYYTLYGELLFKNIITYY